MHCEKTGGVAIFICKSKAPPLKHLEDWLKRCAPPSRHKTVHFDQGGELGPHPKIRGLFERYGYDIQTAVPNSSNEIGGADRMHRTVTYAIRTMLHAAGLPYAFWPCTKIAYSGCPSDGWKTGVPVSPK